MGRRTVASYDDSFSTKFRGVVGDVLDRIHRHKELQHVNTLYSSRSRDHINQEREARPEASGSSREPNDFAYTFDHFVEHLDPNDNTTHNLIELLVTITARKAIARAVEQNNDTSTSAQQGSAPVPFPTSPAIGTNSTSSQQYVAPPWTRDRNARIWRECQREEMHGRAVQTEIRTLTRRNRRSRRGDESDTSSDSMQGQTPPPTRTVFSTMTDPATTTALSTFGVHDSANAATTRAVRVGQRTEPEYRWLQRDLSSIRRRLDQRRDDIMGLTATRNQGATGAAPTTSDVRSSSVGGSRASRPAYENLTRSSSGPRQPSSSNSPSANTDVSYVRRFLSQPFPSDTRQPATSSSTASTSFTAGESSGPGLQGTLSSQAWSPPSPVLFSHPASTLDPAEVQVGDQVAAQRAAPTDSGTEARFVAVQAALQRLASSATATANGLDPVRLEGDRAGDFEAFSSRRRTDRRGENETRDGNVRDALDSNLPTATSVRTMLDYANNEQLGTNFESEQDDYNPEAEPTDGVAGDQGRDPLARRLELPVVQGRSVSRLPPRLRTRSFYRHPDATL